MATPLLRTKLYVPPLRPELVSRPRLIELLNEGLNGKLASIAATAGFGKTTLLSEWTTVVLPPGPTLDSDSASSPAPRLTYPATGAEVLKNTQYQSLVGHEAIL